MTLLKNMILDSSSIFEFLFVHRKPKTFFERMRYIYL